MILLAVDETDEAIEAARQARQLFGPDATYLAVNVAEHPPGWSPILPTWGAVYAYPYAAPYPLVDEEISAPDGGTAADEARETARVAVDEAGVDAAAIGEVGDPTTIILGAADAHNADVIVVGVSEKGWFRRLIDGSVSNALARVSTRPVLIAGQQPQ